MFLQFHDSWICVDNTEVSPASKDTPYNDSNISKEVGTKHGSSWNLFAAVKEEKNMSATRGNKMEETVSCCWTLLLLHAFIT